MEQVPVKYERHIFVCVNDRQEGDCCSNRGGLEISKALRDYVNKHGLFHRFNISKSRCLGHCSEGPTIAIYPDGKIFKNVSIKDIDKIINEYLS
ncbi:MAG: (2Fe-2S) ferredoxin domain-containing protein [Candidatus Aenigmarchaeota archaeon]|nr:(2Fe-2S) ferredoxin domain-containing protein [Candidatus Aenigmarchaeota archaeon]